jgi:hypothetical protein
LQPHRDNDPETKLFLDGLLTKYRTVQLQCTWEPIRQIWVDGIVVFDSALDVQSGGLAENKFVNIRVRTVF